MKQLRVGIIGLGVGMAHAETYAALPDCIVSAVCDYQKDKQNEAKQKWPSTRVIETAEQLCTDSEIDVVSIASFDADHASQVLLALKAGKHVFAEKPLCRSSAELAAITNELRRPYCGKLATNLILRHSPRFQYLKTLLAEEKLGRIFSVETGYHYGRLEKLIQGWRGKDPNYSAVLGGGIHVIDLIQWLLGKQIVAVSAFGNRIASEGAGLNCDDLITANLKFENGMVGSLSVNFGCVYPHFHPLRVYGTEASFINALKAAELWNSKSTDAEPELITAEYPGVAKGTLIPNFISAILGRAPLEISYKEIRSAVQVCLAIDKALLTGAVEAVEK